MTSFKLCLVQGPSVVSMIKEAERQAEAHPIACFFLTQLGFEVCGELLV